MNVNEACDVMNGVLLDAWGGAGYATNNIRWKDVAGDVPTEDFIWCRVTIKHSESPQTSFGDDTSNAKRYSNEGTVFVQCFAPVGSGMEAARTIAEIVVKGYRNSRHADVWFRNARMKEVGTSGAFEQINVLTDFTYDD